MGDIHIFAQQTRSFTGLSRINDEYLTYHLTLRSSLEVVDFLREREQDVTSVAGGQLSSKTCKTFNDADLLASMQQEIASALEAFYKEQTSRSGRIHNLTLTVVACEWLDDVAGGEGLNY